MCVKKFVAKIFGLYTKEDCNNLLTEINTLKEEKKLIEEEKNYLATSYEELKKKVDLLEKKNSELNEELNKSYHRVTIDISEDWMELIINGKSYTKASEVKEFYVKHKTELSVEGKSHNPEYTDDQIVIEITNSTEESRVVMR